MDSRDPRRAFTRNEVWRAWQLQGQVCKLCRRKLPFDLMHGDHMVPWSQGGLTVQENLQVLCGACNLRKGARGEGNVEVSFTAEQVAPGRGEPRRWQAEAMPVVLDALLREPVLIEACPGAGKTQFGLEVAYRLVTEGKISRVLVVVPTLGIADTWNRAASSSSPRTPTLPLHSPRDWRAVDPIGDVWLGAVVTYQSLFAATEMFLAHATDPGHKTLVIFDEVHHAGANESWGQSAQAAFAAGAKSIISLTGTPFRTHGDPIVFVPSWDGYARPHYRYTYDEAIRDGACRAVQFVETRGETKFRTDDGHTHTVTFDDIGLSEVEERQRLRAALEWIGEGSIAAKMLEDANNYIIGLRKQGDKDAGGLVVCVDCDHAARVADYMSKHVLRHRPVVACSRLYDPNDPAPVNALRRFAHSHTPWIVAVNMVSEGIDIPRLRVVVYLTNRLTVLSFRQIVGRVVRTDPMNGDDHGRVYIPADRRLVEMARQVTDDPDLLPAPVTIVMDQQVQGVPSAADRSSRRAEFETLGTVGQQGGVFDTSGRSVNAILVDCARLFIRREGLTGTDPESLAIAAADVPELREALLALRVFL